MRRIAQCTKLDIWMFELNPTPRRLFTRLHHIVYALSVQLPSAVSPAQHDRPIAWPGLLQEQIAWVQVAACNVNPISLFTSIIDFLSYEITLSLQWHMNCTAVRPVSFSQGDQWQTPTSPTLTIYQNNILLSTEIQTFKNQCLEECTALISYASLEELAIEVWRAFIFVQTWPSQNMHQSTPFSFLTRFTTISVLTRLLWQSVNWLEKAKRYLDAILVLRSLLASPYVLKKRGKWWIRLCIDLEHIGEKDQAAVEVKNGLNDPEIDTVQRKALMARLAKTLKKSPPMDKSSENLQALEHLNNSNLLYPRKRKRASKLKLMRNVPTSIDIPIVVISGHPLNCKTGEKSRFVGYDGEHCSVEGLALQHYILQEAAREKPRTCFGWHCEGYPFRAIFGLLHWDAFFHPIPHVFQMPFQKGPLDLDTPEFYSRRETIFNGLWKEMTEGNVHDILKRMATTWHEHYGRWNPVIHWEHSVFGLRQLQAIAAALTSTQSVCVWKTFGTCSKWSLLILKTCTNFLS